MTPRPTHIRLEEIIERIERIQSAEILLLASENDGDIQVFEMLFDSILYQLVVIGEAVKDLDDTLKEKYSEIAWKDIAGMRDFLVHQYHRTDAKIVRDTVEKQLNSLKKVCEIELELGL